MREISVIPQLKKKDGKQLCTIIIRAFINRRPVASISTGKKVPEKFWDPELRKIKDSFPNAALLNTVILHRISTITGQLLKHELAGTIINAQVVKDIFSGYNPAHDFYEFCEKKIKENYSNTETIKTYSTEITKMQQFKPLLSFADIDYRFLESYRNYMQRILLNRPNTIWKSFKFINSMLNLAIKHGGIIDKNPFDQFDRGKYDQPDRTFLTIQEVESIQQLIDKPETPDHMRRVAVYFVLMCYSGLRFEDAMQFNPDDHIIQNERLVKRTSKGAGKLVNIKLYNRLSTVVDLVKLYPLHITNQDFNRWLKHIAVLAGITKNLTTHVGRHSFGGFLSDAGIDKEIAQQMLGHRDRKSTDIYYHIKNKRIDDAAGKLNDL